MSGIIPASASGDNRSAAQWPPQSPGQKPYPEMPKMSDDKPLLTSLGASGVAIFSGIITSEEYNPDFYWRDGIKIYEQMLRSDGQIRAIRQVVENPILRATWSIEPGSESPRDKEIASFIETCLFHDMTYTTADGRTRHQAWAQILRHILMHLWYGFMTFEVNYRQEDGWIKWAKWEPLLPRTIWRWWVGRDTELVGVQQWTFKDWNYAFVDIPVEKLMLFVHQQEGANYEGLSLLRTAYKHWWYKQNFEKIEAIGIERNAVVPPVITLPPNFTSADIAAAQTLGANMRASELGYATLPPGWLLEYPKGMTPFTAQVQPAIAYHDILIARNVLAQFINLGSTETGAFALADAQQEMFLQALEAVTDYICDIINADAIQRLVDYNYDNVAVYPRLRASKLANADISQVAEAIGKLKAREANFLTPDPEMEDYLREQFGFPKAPKSVVQALNPTAESDPARPDNANAQDHTTQQNTPATNNSQQQAQAAQQAQVTAANNAIAPSAPGDGGALSETLEETRLLREAVASIAGLDAVERGMLFYNMHHRGPGPGGGQFEAGGSDATDAQRAQYHERKAVRHERAAREAFKKRDAARAKGDHEAAARYHAQGIEHLEAAHTARANAADPRRVTTLMPPRPEGRKQSVKRWSGNPNEPLSERDGGMVFFNPNHDPHSGEFSSGGAGGASGEGEAKGGRGSGRSRAAGGKAKGEAKPRASRANKTAKVVEAAPTHDLPELPARGKARVNETPAQAMKRIAADHKALEAFAKEHSDLINEHPLDANGYTKLGPTERAKAFNRAIGQQRDALGNEFAHAQEAHVAQLEKSQTPKGEALRQAYRDWASGRAYLNNAGHYRVYPTDAEGYKTGNAKAASWGSVVKSAFPTLRHSADSHDVTAFSRAAWRYQTAHPEEMPPKFRKGGLSEPDFSADVFTLSESAE